MLHTLNFDDMNTSFSKYQTPNPTDPSKPTYSLPDYLNPYVLALLEKMNDHHPPDNLAIKYQIVFVNFCDSLIY